jgi:DNA-binding XRE family transcriptional regulator
MANSEPPAELAGFSLQGPLGQISGATRLADSTFAYLRAADRLAVDLQEHEQQATGVASLALAGVFGELAQISQLPPAEVNPGMIQRRSELRDAAAGLLSHLGLGDEILRVAASIPVDREADSVTLGQRIRAARKSQSLTQAQLGEMLGVNRFTVHAYENGHRKVVSHALANKLITHLDVEVPLSLTPRTFSQKTDP